MVQGARKLARQLCYQVQALLRIKFSWNNIHKEEGKSRLLPGWTLLFRGLISKNLHTLPSNFQVLCVSSYQVYLQDNKTQEQRVHTSYTYNLLPPQGKDKYIFRMPPSKKKLLKPKEVSLESTLKDEAPNIELPNDENKLFDVDDGVGTSTIPDLSVPSEDEEEEVSSNNVWEYAIDTLFKLSPLHPDGKSLRKWIKHQNMDDMEMFYQWDEKYISIGELSTSYLENSWNEGNPEFLKTNSIKNLHMLWKYLHHLVREAQESPIPGNPFSILFPDQFHMERLEDSNQNTSSESSTGYQGQTKQDSRYKSNQNANQLLAFKKSIKREVSQSMLKDEK